MQLLFDENIITTELLDSFFNLVSLLPEWGSEIYVDVKKAT